MNEYCEAGAHGVDLGAFANHWERVSVPEGHHTTLELGDERAWLRKRFCLCHAASWHVCECHSAAAHMGLAPRAPVTSKEPSDGAGDPVPR